MSGQSSNLNTLADLISYINQQDNNDQFLNYLKDSVWVNVSTKEFTHKIYGLAAKLQKLGIKKGDKIALFSDSSPNWLICDLSCQLLGAVTMPMFTDISPENLKYQLQHSKAKYAFVIGGDKWQTVKPHIAQFKYVFTHEFKSKNDKAISISNFFEEYDTHIKFPATDIKKDDLATIIYTSGSTGMPKGVCLTHGNLVSQIKDAKLLFHVNQKDITLSYLPLAHIFERVVMYFYLTTNASNYFADEINNVPELLKEIKPTVMTTVPRLLEKIHSKVISGIAEASFTKKFIAKSAIYYALKIPRKFCKYCPLYSMFHKLIYKKLLGIFGGRIKIMISGGAPLDNEIYSFFTKIGLNLYQSYGLTEASPGISANCAKSHKIFSAGKPLPSVKVKIAKNGEILAKGANIMTGYLNNTKATKEVISKGGWLKTGDLGYVDDQGYLYVTGRIKELQKTSTGKYVSTIQIEQKLKKLAIIDNVMVIADERKFVSAIIFPDLTLIKEKKLSDKKIEEMINHHVTKINKTINSWEKIRKFHIAKTPPTIENAELTPSMKLRRHIILKNYKKLLDKLYS